MQTPRVSQLPSPAPPYANPHPPSETTPTQHIVHLITQPRPEPISIVVVLFSWVVLHVLIKAYDLVNKYRQKYG